MRAKKLGDYKRAVNGFRGFTNYIRSIHISSGDIFENGGNFSISSGIVSICGKNGVGKSTLLKSIYHAVSKNEGLIEAQVSNEFEVEIGTVEQGSVYKTSCENTNPNIVFLEAARECHLILEYIRDVDNFDEVLEGLESSLLFDNSESLVEIQKIVGKKYKKISLYEIEGVLGDDIVFPFFEIVDSSNAHYTNASMGMGEFVCLYVYWYLNWISKDTICLIDELDSYVSLYSQKYLVEYLYKCSATKKIAILLSTHSEVIIRSIGTDNVVVLSKLEHQKTKFLPTKREITYLRAIGITPKYKNTVLVEDWFAQKFAAALLRYADFDLFEITEFYQLRGDSDLAKVAKHLNVDRALRTSWSFVFDGDAEDVYLPVMASSIHKILPLPGANKSSPEIEIWSIVGEKIEEIANVLSASVERFNEVIEECQHDDHHDRFESIASKMGLSAETLIDACINCWVKHNEELSKKFAFLLSIPSMKMERRSMKKCLSGFFGENMPPEISGFNFDLPGECKVDFDGVVLSISAI